MEADVVWLQMHDLCIRSLHLLWLWDNIASADALVWVPLYQCWPRSWCIKTELGDNELIRQCTCLTLTVLGLELAELFFCSDQCNPHLTVYLSMLGWLNRVQFSCHRQIQIGYVYHWKDYEQSVSLFSFQYLWWYVFFSMYDLCRHSTAYANVFHAAMNQF